jgi:ATP adenylyltransferase
MPKDEPAAPRIWAPWRAAYLKGDAPKVEGCLFCGAAALPEAGRRDGLVLDVGEDSLTMLNRYPYSGGHLMVAPRRHAASLEELTDAEHDGLFRAVRRALVALKETVRPEGVNVGINLGRAAGAGIAAHLHVHLVPRWVGDVNFMTAVAEARVISEALLASYDALSPRFTAGAP